MPGQDGTGPMGQGAMTGRRMGSCGQDDTTTRNTQPGFGRGPGRCGRGRGRGMRMGKRGQVSQ
ncbi:MAG: DUF5320 domain-containing protein [Candidatus Methanomethylophilaceae archaeon]|nr:DUF5320 domain-containing protein [Candidatus Methanomethylophilaceae archaeon]